MRQRIVVTPRGRPKRKREPPLTVRPAPVPGFAEPTPEQIRAAELLEVPEEYREIGEEEY